MTPIVELRGICKVYEMEAVRVHALRDICLTLASGEFAAIMGASGSGKSTLLNILGCLDQPSRGIYLLEGERVDRFDEDRLAECRRIRLGFMFQSFNLLHRGTSLENVELPMVYQGVNRRERMDRACQALEMVGLADRMDHLPSQLSGGQQQRVALARALVTRPRLLLADEPTGNLDSKTAEEVLDLLVRLQVEEQLTVAMVTHDPDVAACAHRIVILHDGLVVHDQVSPSRGGPPIPRIKTLAGRIEAAAGTPSSVPSPGS
ncbi:MAG TPA: ABC transporter ATP-binding protein [Phycisphaerae bacterium]|nr:ABC transporter ATP-binding protein [Phycisphaerae bacterium]